MILIFGIIGFSGLWNLSIPSITRKTDKGLPKYVDAEESDVFILSGAEDLVPLLEYNSEDETWLRHEQNRSVNGKNYRINRYRPRIEGLFARIERWTNISDPTDVAWRSISKDNITTWYGKRLHILTCKIIALTHLIYHERPMGKWLPY